MKTPVALLKLSDEYELDIFTAKLFETVVGRAINEWILQLRTLGFTEQMSNTVFVQSEKLERDKIVLE